MSLKKLLILFSLLFLCKTFCFAQDSSEINKDKVIDPISYQIVDHKNKYNKLKRTNLDEAYLFAQKVLLEDLIPNAKFEEFNEFSWQFLVDMQQTKYENGSLLTFGYGSVRLNNLEYEINFSDNEFTLSPSFNKLPSKKIESINKYLLLYSFKSKPQLVKVLFPDLGFNKEQEFYSEGILSVYWLEYVFNHNLNVTDYDVIINKYQLLETKDTQYEWDYLQLLNRYIFNKEIEFSSIFSLLESNGNKLLNCNLLKLINNKHLNTPLIDKNFLNLFFDKVTNTELNIEDKLVYLHTISDIYESLGDIQQAFSIQSNIFELIQQWKKSYPLLERYKEVSKQYDEMSQSIEQLESSKLKAEKLKQSNQQFKITIIFILLIIGLLSFFYFYKFQKQKKLKKLNLNLQEHSQFLIDKNLTLDLYASTIVHDYGSPIRTIKSTLDIVQIEGIEHDKKVELIKRSEDANNFLNKITNDFSNFVARNVDIKETSVHNLSTPIEIAKNHLSLKNVNCTISSDLPNLIFHLDEIVIVFQNLLKNAVKYCPQDRIPHIQINTEEDANNYKIFIIDNGYGLKMANIEKIFDPFVRFTPSNSIKGSGLGLSIVSKILSKYGATINAHNNLTQGATFVINWPKKSQ